MRFLIFLLIFGGINQVFSRSHGVRRDNICSDASSETLKIIDDAESCGGFIACVGLVAQRFKCFSDQVYGNGTSICVSCEENIDEFYEDDVGIYGTKRTTKKKFTYKQTKRTKSTTKRYGRPTKPPMTRTYPTQTTIREIETTSINNFTISFGSEFYKFICKSRKLIKIYGKIKRIHQHHVSLPGKTLVNE